MAVLMTAQLPGATQEMMDGMQPLLGPQPQIPQTGRGPADAVVEFAVADLPGRPGQRDPLRVPGGQPPVEQVLTCVEQLRHRVPSLPSGASQPRPSARSRSQTACR